MESIDPRKQKRLGPAPIASFEKSFEDNSQGPSPIGLTGTNQKQNMDTNCGGGKNNDYDESKINNKGYELKNINTTTIIKYERPKVSPPDPPQQQQQLQQQNPKISVSTPSKKLHDIGKRPPPLQCSIDDGGGGGNSGTSVGSNVGAATAVGASSRIVKSHLTNTLGLNTPSTPRIDISRASSSSQHEDSRDSSPENVFEQIGTGTLQEAIGLGFREEGAFDLKSSTEELYFMDPEQKKEEKEKMQQVRKSPVMFKFDDHQTYLQQHQRKDSASSEVAALLCISGRTSRISSVGSQGSAVSRLSAISGVSGISRSPSPHRMLLETSFCGPKPLENIVDGNNINSTEPNTSETLEYVLLSRKHDPTAVVLAEGIKIECSPKRKMLSNGGAKKKTLSHEKATSADYNLIKPAPKTLGTNLATTSRKIHVSSGRRGSGKQVIGVTESGTKYIRINLKPDHLYPDKGIAPNEKIIEVSSGGPGTTSVTTNNNNKTQDKPSTLHLTHDISGDRLTPSSSPKPARHIALVRETSGITGTGTGCGVGGGSRSPSPGNVLRKSSFCSLFKTAKDSPESPRDRSRSKSRDRLTPQSQSDTPNKQKSVLAIFKPKRSGSKSKCSSPIDPDIITAQQLDDLSQVEFKFNSDNAQQQQQDRSRPASRLRYYDTPLDGKSIHIPLHTPPEEKDVKKMIPGNLEVKFVEQRPMSAPTPGPSGTKPTVRSPSLESSSITTMHHQLTEIRPIAKETPPALPVKSPKPLQLEKIQRIENLDAIQTLPQDVKEKERTWSLEVQRHSSQDSQDTVISADGSSGNNSKKPKTNLDNVIESPLKENGLIKHPQVPPPQPPKVINVQKVTVQQSQQQQLQQQQTQPIQPNDIVSKEKKRILFATRIGSGSQEQIFSTQFSLSKTESLSSQLSEQTSIPESPAEGREAALHRSDTVIRRPEELRKKDSLDEQNKSDNNSIEPIKIQNSSDERRRKSKSSEDEDKRPVVVMMRRKDSSEENRRKSKSASEEDDGTQRHSKYLENFDVRKQRFQDNQKRQSNNRNSSDSSIKESYSNSREEPEPQPPKIPPKQPIKPPPSVSPLLAAPPPASDRQSVTSTEDPLESSESERDSESSKIAMDPNRVKRHLPRHIGVIEDHESTGLVSQESFDDDLPYIPTTLPEERPQGVALIPMKERAHMDVKTFSLDRPRSTTPLNPAHLEEYCGTVTPDDPNEQSLVRGEKLRISLPRKDSNINKNQTQKSKSPRRPSNTSGKSWFEFAEQGIRGTVGTTNTTSSTATITTPTQSGDDLQQQLEDKSSSPPPPPLPPRKPSSTSISSGQWINFENIPEKRKAPKRITVLPKDNSTIIGQDGGNKIEPIHYNYVKPEECQCECHEVERESNSNQKLITNVDLLQQGGGGGVGGVSGNGEDMQPLLDSDCHEGIYPSDSSQDYDYNIDDHQSSDERRRYEIDTPSSMRNSRSNRSSGLSDDHDTSPDQKSSLRSKRSNNSSRNQ